MSVATEGADGPLAQLVGVSYAFGDRVVLRDVAVTIEPGQFTGVVGPSGSGKTTMLRLLLGGATPSTGTVVRRRGVRVGYVPQVEQVDWSFPITVEECVLMARCEGRRLPWPSRAERAEVRSVLSRLGIEDLYGRHIRALSGGQQQRVFVARALLGRPDLLLLDEPTSGVDVHTRHEVLHLLDDLNRDGMAIVLTTHDLNGIASHLPHLVCLNTSVIGQGPPREVLTVDVLEDTFGARMSILEHAGLPYVVDAFRHEHVAADDPRGPAYPHTTPDRQEP